MDHELQGERVITLRVLFVIDALGLGGGAEHSLAEILPELRIRGIDCRVVCLRGRVGGLQRRLLDAGFDVSVLKSRGLFGKAVELRAIIRKLNPDVVHSSLAESNLVSRFSTIATKTHVINSLVSNFFEFNRFRGGVFKRSVRRLFFAFDAATGRIWVDQFHAVTNDIKNSYVREYGIQPEAITVIPRGRSRSRLGESSQQRRNATRERLSIPSDSFVVVTVGRQHRLKGHVTLIRAIGRIAHFDPRVHLILVGREDSGSIDLAREVESTGFKENFLILGHRDDVPDILCAADVFAFPSLSEGIAGALIEAMAMSLPVVASDLPGLRDVLEPGGNSLLVPPGDEKAMERAIKRLSSNSGERAEFGLRSKELFEEHFQIDRIVDRMITLYSEVSSGNPHVVPR